jgi:hypothetical protein
MTNRALPPSLLCHSCSAFYSADHILTVLEFLFHTSNHVWLWFLWFKIYDVLNYVPSFPFLMDAIHPNALIAKNLSWGWHFFPLIHGLEVPKSSHTVHNFSHWTHLFLVSDHGIRPWLSLRLVKKKSSPESMVHTICSAFLWCQLDRRDDQIDKASQKLFSTLQDLGWS